MFTTKKQTSAPRPIHGGRLNHAINKYAIAKQHWLDLSTGINPKSWPVPAVPEHVYRCLPDNDELLTIAANYYASDLLQVTSGSQQSIEILPKILGENLTIGIVSPSYAEHIYAWKKNGHNIILLSPDEIQSNIQQLDCLVIINPNNPSAYVFSPEKLRQYQQYFISRKSKKGYLIVDEAFMDHTPELSVIAYVNQGNLIVLRSIGKFFGLAGIRCGFIFAQQELLLTLSNEMMPWSVNHPARWIVSQVLADQQWIKENKNYLNRQSQQLSDVLTEFFDKNITITGCSLFKTVYCNNAEKIYQLLAKKAVLVRLLDNKSGLRFGLPVDNKQLEQLVISLKQCI